MKPIGEIGSLAYFDSRGPRAALHAVAGGHDDIAHHRGRRRCAARALAVEHQRRPAASASTTTALKAPLTAASGWSSGTSAG